MPINTRITGDGPIKKSAAFTLILCLLSIALFTGCTTENHRVMVTIKNTTEVSETIEFYIDDELEISTSIEPKASVEKEYELSKGSHSFKLYHEVNGTFELSQSQNNNVEADSSYFFELA